MQCCLRSVLREEATFTSRFSSTLTSGSSPTYYYNRNPRNLERLRIAHKPIGFNLERKGRTFWNKLILTNHRSSRSVTADIIHNSGMVVVSASTNEWALAKHLYSKNDIAAHVNLARVLAYRCLETGISEIACFIERKPETKIDFFLTELEKEGIALEEPKKYEHPKPSDPFRPEKPWEIF